MEGKVSFYPEWLVSFGSVYSILYRKGWVPLLKKYFGLDFLKFAMAILIVLRHVGQNRSFFSYDSFFFQMITNSFSTIGVPVFFIISGFLFFRKSCTYERLQNQIKRICLLYLAWIVVFSPIKLLILIKENNININSLIGIIWETVFDGFWYHLWYLPALVFALTIVYIISKYKSDAECLVIVLFLFVISLYDTYSVLFPEIFHNVMNYYLSLFITTRNGVFWGPICVFAGKIISKNVDCIVSKNMMIILFLTIISLIIIPIENYYTNIIRGFEHVNNILVSSLISAVLLVLISVKISYVYRFCTDNIRKMSTIIYFVHPLIIMIFSVIHNHMYSFSSYIAIGGILFITILSSLFVVHIHRFTILKRLY